MKKKTNDVLLYRYIWPSQSSSKSQVGKDGSLKGIWKRRGLHKEICKYTVQLVQVLYIYLYIVEDIIRDFMYQLLTILNRILFNYRI